MVTYIDKHLVDATDLKLLLPITTARLNSVLLNRGGVFDAILMGDDGIILLKKPDSVNTGLEVFKDNGRVIVLIHSHEDYYSLRSRIITALTGYFLHLRERESDRHISDEDVEWIMNQVNAAYDKLSSSIHRLMPKSKLIKLSKD